MKTVRQLLRQPMKTLFGVILVTLAAAALCVCLGQSFAAKETEERLNRTFQTAAFPKGDEDQEQSSWLDTYAAQHPEVVKTVSRVGLASAYIPELTIDNWAQHWHKPMVTLPNLFTPYDTAILEITLTHIGEVYESTQTYAKTEAGKYILDENGTLISIDYPGEDVAVELTGTVERAVALEEGYPDPTGFTARINLNVESREALDALNLEVGGRYLVYGTNYVDQDWQLRHAASQIMTWNKDTELPEWNLDTFEGIYDYHSYEQDGITYYSYWTRDEEGQPEEVITTDNLEAVPAIGFKCKIGDLHHGMTLSDLKQFRSITMSCSNDALIPESAVYQTSEGEWVCVVTEEISYVDRFGHTIVISRDEKARLYQEPTIVRLTGTAEELLASEEGALWAEARHNVEVNNHAFAFLGVDRLGYIENFDSGEARIVQGRDFTDEELETGARVCVISKQLAEANDLTVGDTIDPQFYDPDMGLKYQLSVSKNSFLPKPFYYFGNTTELRPAQSYTVVGIYEQNDPTPSLFDSYGETVNPYGFTSNTIFAPKSAIDGAMEYGEVWLFKTAVLHNGALDEFQLAAIEAGLGEAFQYTDNGYSAVEASLAVYQENALRAEIVGMSVYAVMLVLFLSLFPARQKQVLSTMEALGTEKRKQIGFLLASSWGILLPGSLMGMGLGILLWDHVVSVLSENASAMLDIQMNIGDMGMIALSQLLISMLLVVILAIPMTGKQALRRRK